MNRDRLLAWGQQLRLVHQELRGQLEHIREQALRGQPGGEVTAELRSFCVGFCGALAGHHTAEDQRLFPRVLDDHPELGPVTARLREDHQLLAGLLADLDRVTRTADTTAIVRHLDGITAIMESHFGYEERQLTAVLDAMTAPDPGIGALLGRRPGRGEPGRWRSA